MKNLFHIPNPAALNTKDAIIKILGETWPLTAKKLHSEIRTRYGSVLTYQAVHKTVTQLQEEGILTEESGSYMLDVQWLSELKNFTELTQSSYSRQIKTGRLEIGTGSSVEPNAFKAGREAAQKALAGIKLAKEYRLALVFASVSYEENFKDMLRGIRSIVGNCEIAGCTPLGGEINDKAQSKSVVVAVFAGSKENFEAYPVPFEVGSAYYEKGECEKIIESIKKIREEKSLDCGVIFFPGYTVSNKTSEGSASDEFIRQWNAKMGLDFPLIGGLAGDEWRFQKTWTFCGDSAFNNSIVFVGFKTKTKIGVAMEHAYAPLDGKTYVLHVKDGFVIDISVGRGKPQPATQAYSKISGLSHKELQKIVPSHIKEIIAQNRYPPAGVPGSLVISFPIQVEGTKIKFQTQYKDGEKVRFLHTTHEKMLEASVRSLNLTASSAGIKKITGALVLPCATLDQVFSKVPHEVDRIKKLREYSNVPIFGCYAAGEIGALKGERCMRGSGTFTALVFGV